MSGKTPSVSYSFNPAAWQWWAWFCGRLVAIVVGLWLGVSFVADKVFDENLYQFHLQAKPEIHSLVKDSVAAHEKDHVTVERVHQLETQAGRVDEKFESLQRQLDSMDRKLDAILKNGKTNG